LNKKIIEAHIIRRTFRSKASRKYFLNGYHYHAIILFVIFLIYFKRIPYSLYGKLDPSEMS